MAWDFWIPAACGSWKVRREEPQCKNQSHLTFGFNRWLGKRRIQKVRRKSGNRGRCRKLSLWKRLARCLLQAWRHTANRRNQQITVYNQEWLTIDCQGTNLPRGILSSMGLLFWVVRINAMHWRIPQKRRWNHNAAVNLSFSFRTPSNSYITKPLTVENQNCDFILWWFHVACNGLNNRIFYH